MGPFCVTESNPTHQLTDPTQPNPLQVENCGPNPIQLLSVNLLRAEFAYQIVSTIATHKKNEKSRPNPTQSNPTHGQLTLRRHRPRRKCPLT